MSFSNSNKSVFITGGADGIGAGFARQLFRAGYGVTVADINEPLADALAHELTSAGGQALAVRCDVASEAAQSAAFEAHVRRHGSLDIAILNAGIMESGSLWGDSDDWQHTLRINLAAVMIGVRLAVRVMTRLGSKGVIMVVASAGGIFPMPTAPVYSAAKAGCVMLVQSLGPTLLRSKGIRICGLCPQFVDTALVRGVRTTRGNAVAEELTKEVGGRLLKVEQVVDVGVRVLGDSSTAGQCAIVLANGDVMRPLRPSVAPLELRLPQEQPLLFAVGPLPQTAHKIAIRKLSTNFREAAEVVSFQLPTLLPHGVVLVKNYYCGINASDINFSSGRYQSGGSSSQPPFDAGFEACGVVAAVGPNVSGLVVGQAVATMQYGGFSEFAVVPAKQCLPVPRPSPEVVALLTSGLTASISLAQGARLRPGETILITAAAGGTGQFYVQLAKAAGAHVIATCGSAEKGAMLRALGADRVVNYREEALKSVLKKEYPGGVDVVAELVGGDMFTTSLNALAPKGRLLVIGAVSQYSSGWTPSPHVGLPEKLLAKGAALVGFFLPLHAVHFKRHLAVLLQALEAGQLSVAVDSTKFVGVEAVFDAVDHLQSGRSMGKVCVAMAGEQQPARLYQARL